jgi:hypothetical protein
LLRSIAPISFTKMEVKSALMTTVTPSITKGRESQGLMA